MSEPLKLNDSLVPAIKKANDEGKTYVQIALQLKKQGYVNESGGDLVDANISAIMIRHGYRKMTRRGCKIKNHIATNNHSLNDVVELLSSNLNDKLKVSVLKELAKEL